MSVFAFLLLSASVSAKPARPETGPGFTSQMRKAAAARERGELETAIDLYGKCVRLQASSAEAWWYLGASLYDEGRWVEAKEALGRETALEPRDSRAFSLIGLSEFELGNYHSALLNLKHGIASGVSQFPEIARPVRFHYGLLLAKEGQFEQALSVYTLFLNDGDRSPEIVEAVGIATLRMNLLPGKYPAEQREFVFAVGKAVSDGIERRQEKSYAEFERILRLYGDRANVHYAFAQVLQRADPDRAMKELERELEIVPQSVPALVTLALKQLGRGNLETALQMAERAVQVDASSFATHVALGRILLEKGDTERATAELEKAVQIAPDSPANHFALARAYSRTGKTDAATKEMTTFEKLNAELAAAKKQ